MIDTGFHRARAALLETMATANIRGAVLTHWHEDHAGNVELLAHRGIPLLLRPDTEAILRERRSIHLYRHLVWGRPPALVSDLERFESDELRCVPTPGHSEDHQVVWFPETRTLFSGDLWLGVRSRIMNIAEDPYRTIESLRAVAALEPERMFDAHRGPVAKPVEALNARADWLTKTLDAIAERVRAGLGDRSIVRDLLGGEEAASLVSLGEYSRRNLVRVVRRRLRNNGTTERQNDRVNAD